MAKDSAGILPYRFHHGELEVLLVHPGGPFWAKKDIGAWSIPKGEIEPGEDLLKAAIRETEEETDIKVYGEPIPLRSVKQKGGKTIYAWLVQLDIEPSEIKGNTFSIEWPPRSGTQKVFPEIDRGGWFDVDRAKVKIIPGQMPFIVELEERFQNTDLKSTVRVWPEKQGLSGKGPSGNNEVQ